jgi:hypothetical protein
MLVAFGIILAIAWAWIGWELKHALLEGSEERK